MKDSNAVRDIFINKEGELRSGWRVVAFFLAFAVCLMLLGVLTAVAGALVPALGRLLVADETSPLASKMFAFGLSQVLSLVSALVASAVCARFLERRSFTSTGFKLHKGWLWDFVYGSAMGAAALGVAIAIARAAGAIRFTIQTDDFAALAGSFLFLFFFFLVAAAFEEVLFRGFAFQALVHNLGPTSALAITSALFGLAHVRTPNASLFSTLNVTLAGVWLGAAYLMTRSLWLATGLHYSWNFVMVFIFGLPVSGWTDFDKLAWLDGEAGGPVWLSGGSYGPEGGAAATIAVMLATIIIWKSRLFSPTEEMMAAIKHGKDSVKDEG
ncbi:MAG: CPBP family intramembrane metalloprotease [Blastocatellia bacterium]|nr:CPBP family intramembrane metalloprotease [Blastocatellia bacterium]